MAGILLSVGSFFFLPSSSLFPPFPRKIIVSCYRQSEVALYRTPAIRTKTYSYNSSVLYKERRILTTQYGSPKVILFQLYFSIFSHPYAIFLKNTIMHVYMMAVSPMYACKYHRTFCRIVFSPPTSMWLV